MNFHFAIHAARSSRLQDFLWIHDYHLFLVGDILRSLDPTLDCGFFLHIPFQISEQFMAEFPEQGLAVLKGLLGYTRVGFQSNKDTLNFLHLVKRYFPGVQIENKHQFESLVFSIRQVEENGVVTITDFGTFPISIKTERVLNMASSSACSEEAIAQLREKIMGQRQGKLFLSVERFDYTKGLLERLDAIDHYFLRHPERLGMDLFYQIAAASRAEVSSYRVYQHQVLRRIQQINDEYGDSDNPVIMVDQQNHPQEEVVQLYKAADIIVVTPLADGMNLVIKEGILCNQNAVFVFSTGAGAENQLFDAGLGDCYLRIGDIKVYTETDHPWAASAVEAAHGLQAGAYG